MKDKILSFKNNILTIIFLIMERRKGDSQENRLLLIFCPVRLRGIHRIHGRTLPELSLHNQERTLSPFQSVKQSGH